MTEWEILLLGAALAMDAMAVSITNGIAEPNMRPQKAVAIAFTYGAFQFGMPMLGYFCGAVFLSAVEAVAPWLSFALLSFLGGKMIADCLSALARRPMRRLPSAGGKVRFGRLLMQGVATSLDALAVGVTLLAAEASGALPMPPPLCAAAIGVVTFVLSLGAVSFGRRVGTAFADTAGVLGGAVLIGIGVKLLFEGIF